MKAGSLPSAARCSSRTSSTAFSQNMAQAPGPLDHRLSPKRPPHSLFPLVFAPIVPRSAVPTPPPPRLGAKMTTNGSAVLASGHGGRQGTFASAVQPRCPREPRTGEAAGLGPASAPPLCRPGSKLRLSGRTALTQPTRDGRTPDLLSDSVILLLVDSVCSLRSRKQVRKRWALMLGHSGAFRSVLQCGFFVL